MSERASKKRPFPVIRSARYVTGAVEPRRIPPPVLPEIAFAGRSNVGKSSLLNALVGRKSLARVSSTPGRTQLLHFFAINDAVGFVDLPGYGYAAVSKTERAAWKGLVEAYLRGRECLAAVVLLCDARREPGVEERGFVEWLHSEGIDVVVVATKCDKLSRAALGQHLRAMGAALGGHAPLATAATAGIGLADLWRVLAEHLPKDAVEALR